MIILTLPKGKVERREALVAYYAGLVASEMASPAWVKTPDEVAAASLRIAEMLADRVIARLDEHAANQKGS